MSTKKPGRGVDHKGRSKRRGKFVALGNGLLTSEAWYSLSGSAVRYYIELRRRFNGANNGDLHLSHDEAKACLGMSSDTVGRVQRELADKGLVRITRLGGFHQRMATTWALTDEPALAAAPTHDYRMWVPKKKPSHQKLVPTGTRNKDHKVVQLKPRHQKLGP